MTIDEMAVGRPRRAGPPPAGRADVGPMVGRRAHPARALVGDGSYLRHQPLRYTTASEENSLAVREAAEALGSTVTRTPGAALWHQLVIAGNGNRWHPAGVGAWLQEARHLQSAFAREAPAGRSIFAANEQIALLLRHLWATDGCIHVRDARVAAAIASISATCSDRLAQDVAALLLRFGIIARIRTVASGACRPVYTVDVTRAPSSSGRSCREIGVVWAARTRPRSGLRAACEQVDANTERRHAAGRSASTQVRQIMRASGISMRRMARCAARPTVASAISGSRQSRATLTDYADAARRRRR